MCSVLGNAARTASSFVTLGMVVRHSSSTAQFTDVGEAYRQQMKAQKAEYLRKYREEKKARSLAKKTGTTTDTQQYKQDYYHSNKERIAEAKKQYYQQNKQKFTQYYQKNMGKYQEYKHKYYTNNKMKIQEKHNVAQRREDMLNKLKECNHIKVQTRDIDMNFSFA